MYHAFQYLELNFAHDAEADIPFPLVVGDVEGGLFFFELPEFVERGVNIGSFREDDRAGHDRFELRFAGVLFRAETLTGEGFRETGDGGDHAGLHFVYVLRFRAVYQADAADFFGDFPAVPARGDDAVADFQNSAGEFYMCEPVAAVFGYADDFGAEGLVRVVGDWSERGEEVEKLFDAASLESGAGEDGKELSFSDGGADVGDSERFPGVEGFHERFRGEGDFFGERMVFRREEFGGRYVGQGSAEGFAGEVGEA